MECRAYGICLDSQSRGYLGKDRKVSSAAGGNLSRMHKTQETAKESRLNFMYSHLRNRTLAARPNSNASRFSGLDFSSEVGPKSFHQLAHPCDEVGSLHRFEQLRGKVVGLKMKDAIPTPAERLDIRRRQERVDPGINQLQIPEALNDDGQARVPIVHEVTAWAGEKFEGGEIRIL